MPNADRTHRRKGADPRAPRDVLQEGAGEGTARAREGQAGARQARNEPEARGGSRNESRCEGTSAMSEAGRLSLLARILRRAGRTLEPLFAPDADDQRRRAARLVALAKEQDGAIRELREQVAAERAELRRMRETRAEDVAETRGTIADLRSGVRRQSTALA